RALGEQYEQISNGKVKLSLLDPIRSPDATEKKITEYGSVFKSTYKRSIFTHDLIVVDARTKEEQAAAAGKAGNNAHIRFIESDSMVQYSTDDRNNARKPTGYLGEDSITTALLKAIEGNPRKLYYIADKSAVAQGGEGSTWANFEGVMQSRNLMPERINIAGLTAIPEDASAVAIIGPAYDFTAEELKVLEDYWNRPRSSLLVTVSAAETPARFRAFLRNLGVTPRHDRVVGSKGGEISTVVVGQFAKGMNFTKDFWDQTVVFEGSTCSLEVRDQNAEDLNTRKIVPYALIETDKDGYWGETDFGQGNPEFDPQRDNKPPLRLAAAVIRGAATDDKLAGEISRMVVISNTDFLDPARFSSIHRDFLASSVDWMIGREQLIGQGPRSFGTYKLPLLDSQVSFINRVNLMFLPAFALLAGAIVWSSRRA
ncbi:MAG: hypothetical protein JWO82_1581, partial [Akkermansiaceae bacterium]|nr:hypothetical protein [Akkermansiaceae bacterium]